MPTPTPEEKQERTAHGDYTGLAREYAASRPGYALHVPDALLGLSKAGGAPLHVADVGAGTGIWTRMMARRGCRTVAVEPNDEMRAYGERTESSVPIAWRKGSAEETGLGAGSVDLLTMASSFHWTDFERATKEFLRVLRPGGWFAALWNTRRVEGDRLLVEIEDELRRRVPHYEKRSSGRSRFCEELSQRLGALPGFGEVLYLEGRHVERMTPARYQGIWRSVNDVRVQAGEEVFEGFLNYIEGKTRSLEYVNAHYVTRVWATRKTEGLGA